MDFAYTLQGWLKGMNSEGRDQGKDMGSDGKTSGSHKLFGRDVASFLLSYFEGDYRPIGTNRFTATYSTSGGFGASSPSLYNGNIRKATYSLANLTDPVVGYAYGYDQLNRLISMNAWFNFNTGSYAWQTSGSASNKLQERVSYDANGNITKYLRKGYSPTNMDSLTYKYYPKSNKLLRVDDSVSVSTYADIDVDDQDSLNYEYDLTGNLVKDSIEGISLITWNLMGKVDSIARYSASSRPELKFLYDAMGNRVGKVVYDGADVTKTWYIRDAQGNIMATYEEENDTLTWTEQHIYGSSRLGYWQPDSMMYPKPTLPATDTFRYVVRAGDKLYEISNHLGNVLASITDRKIPQETGTPNGIADYYLADIATVQDYYPFGMVMPGRNWQAGSAIGYGFGFNGQLKDNEIKGRFECYDFGARTYDARVGVFMSIDPYTAKYNWQSPYVFARNNPISYIDLFGYGAENLAVDPPVKTNILIIIPATAEEVKNVQVGAHGDWFVIVANDMVDAYKQFHTYTGTQYVDNIVIDTHGTITPGNLLVANQNAPTGAEMIDAESVAEFRKKRAEEIKGGKSMAEADGGNEQIDGLIMLSLGIKSGGNLIVNSCRSGGEVEGQELLGELGKITNYRVNLYLSEGMNSGTVMSDGSLKLNTNLFDPSLGTFCDQNNNCYTNKDKPNDGFVMMPANTTTEQIIDLGSDGIHTGNISLQESGTPVTISKKASN